MVRIPVSHLSTTLATHITSNIPRQSSSFADDDVESRDGALDHENASNDGDIDGDGFWMSQLQTHASKLPFTPKPWQLQIAQENTRFYYILRQQGRLAGRPVANPRVFGYLDTESRKSGQGGGRESGRAILLVSARCMEDVYKGLVQQESSLQGIAMEMLGKSQGKEKTRGVRQKKDGTEESAYVLFTGMPPDLCCDNCRDTTHIGLSLSMLESPIGARSPSPSDSGSSDESCRAPDVNGKRKRGAWRVREHLQKAQTAIREWRRGIWERDFGDCLVGPEIIIDDEMLRRVAKQRRFVDSAVLAEEWDAYEAYGAEVLGVLIVVDREEDERKENARRAKVAKYAMTKLQNQAADRERALADRTNRPISSPYARAFIPGTGVFQYEVQSPAPTVSPFPTITNTFVPVSPDSPTPVDLSAVPGNFASLTWHHTTPQMMEKSTVAQTHRRK